MIWYQSNLQTSAVSNPFDIMQKEFGTEFWNDSCDAEELSEAVSYGAVGATSNPVIVANVFEKDVKKWKRFAHERSLSQHITNQDELAWDVIGCMVQEGAKKLYPVFQQSGGKQGFLCAQVNPRFHLSAKAMVEHGRILARLAPNIAIKVPSTQEGIAAMGQLSAEGITVNSTVSFSVAQAVVTAEEIENGMNRTNQNLSPYITIMVGRIDDYIKKMAQERKIQIDPEALDMVGIAIFKKAYQIFHQRGFRSKLLVAAYRHSKHWTELIGENVVQSIPYKWWKVFSTSSEVLRDSIHDPVPSHFITQLYEIPEFRLAYDEGAMLVPDFLNYGASAATIDQFLSGYQRLKDAIS